MPMPILPACPRLLLYLYLYTQAGLLNTWIPGTWTGRSLYGGLVSNGTDGDTIGRLGDRHPCQTVPTQLRPRIWLHQAGRVAGVGMWPRWSKKSSACGD